MCCRHEICIIWFSMDTNPVYLNLGAIKDRERKEQQILYVKNGVAFTFWHLRTADRESWQHSACDNTHERFKTDRIVGLFRWRSSALLHAVVVNFRNHSLSIWEGPHLHMTSTRNELQQVTLRTNFWRKVKVNIERPLIVRVIKLVGSYFRGFLITRTSDQVRQRISSCWPPVVHRLTTSPLHDLLTSLSLWPPFCVVVEPPSPRSVAGEPQWLDPVVGLW